ncbi:MAG: tRNA-dependent cyclodipeptide synthase [Hyphomicrobium sp.]|jgi:tRNA-dependent cyclodipeptide synthase|uniref:tRNA-dependent cyclodipeptide synthase n=1 Tax=Hyphomicrobium sp. TaxID=82 RepID=UPI0025C701DC|nr:tRNA-dependent cyclodipeptide synthase [Hyphomicrobium sp.]MBX9865251.1 tRNA-dependent cyclodipeptide synthase [Hyphomicrobium sp.]
MSGSKSIQYPGPTGPYKVTQKNGAAWKGAEEVRLQISIGNPGTEGDKFYALCEWAAARFPRVVLVVSDTLQRYNVMFETLADHERALAVSRQSGDDWLARSSAAIDLLDSKALVMRWEEVRLTQETAEAETRLRDLYECDDGFKTAIDETVQAFATRGERDLGSDRSIYETHSKAFLLEELAVFSWLCMRAGVDSYAGSWMQGVFNALRAHEGSFFDAYRKDWVQVDFTRNKAYLGPSFGGALEMAA